MKSQSAKPTVLQELGGLWLGLAILGSEIRLSGYQAQPSGLRPDATLPGSELSLSLVNMAQWLTGAFSKQLSTSKFESSGYSLGDRGLDALCAVGIVAILSIGGSALGESNEIMFA